MICSIRPPSLLGFLFLLPFLAAGEARAATWIVDAAGGPGSHFTTLQAAIDAASDGDVLRIRAGDYQPFTLAGKGLSLIGDGASAVRVHMDSSVGIGPSGPGQDILVQGMSFLVSTPAFMQPPGELEIRRTAGAVVMRHVILRGDPSSPEFFAAMKIDRCAQVHLHELRITCGGMSQIPFTIVVPEAALVVRESYVQLEHCEITGCYGGWGGNVGTESGSPGIRAMGSEIFVSGGRIVGGDGAYSPTSISPSGHGGPGILLGGASRLSAHGRSSTAIRGGDGGDGGNPLSMGTPGHGGDGLELQSSTAIVMGFTPEGGQGGRDMMGTQAPSGVPFQPVSSVQHDPAALPPLAELLSEPVLGAVTGTRLDAAPGSFAFLAIGLQSAFLPVPPLSGALLVGNGLVAGPVILPAAGTLSIQVVASWPPDVPYYLQFLVLEPAGAVWLSNSIVLLLRS